MCVSRKKEGKNKNPFYVNIISKTRKGKETEHFMSVYGWHSLETLIHKIGSQSKFIVE